MGFCGCGPSHYVQTVSRKAINVSFFFEGLDNPTTTPVPDVVFDRLLSKLGEAELKALLYIIRRTFGFKKDRDPISFSQFLHGITTKDGRVLDEGCGIRNRTTLSRALKALETKGIIRSQKGTDGRGDHATTVYRLRFKHEGAKGVGRIAHHCSANPTPPVVRKPYIQQTLIQEIEEQQAVVEELVQLGTEEAQAQERQRAQRLSQLYARYGTTQREEALWSRVLKQMVSLTSKAAYAMWLAPSRLLSLRHNLAVIGVQNQAAKMWLACKLQPAIRQAFAGLGRKVQHLEFEVLSAEDGSPIHSFPPSR